MALAATLGNAAVAGGARSGHLGWVGWRWVSGWAGGRAGTHWMVQPLYNWSVLRPAPARNACSPHPNCPVAGRAFVDSVNLSLARNFPSSRCSSCYTKTITRANVSGRAGCRGVGAPPLVVCSRGG